MSHWPIRPALRRYSCIYKCLDRPLQLQEVEASRISRQLAHEGAKVFTPTHRPHLPPGDTPVLRRRTIHNIAWTPEIVTDFVMFSLLPPKECWDITSAEPRQLLPRPLKFTFHQLYHSSTQYSTPTASWNNPTSRDWSVIPAWMHF